MSNVISFIGFGSQAKAWSANLKDSKIECQILLRDRSKSNLIARSLNFNTYSFSENWRESDIYILLTPDSTHLETLKILESKIPSGSTIIYGHGFSFTKHGLNKEFPMWDHILLAPKSIASEIRSHYKLKLPIYTVASFEACKNPETSRVIVNKLCEDLGFYLQVEATFKEEMLADLVSEQSLLCSLIPYGARKSFELLVKKGVRPELAYLECWHEVKLIADAMTQFGPKGLFQLISSTALYGGVEASKKLLDKSFDDKLEEIYQDIYSMAFTRRLELIDENSYRQKTVEEWSNHPLQKMFEDIRYGNNDDKKN